MKMQFSLSGMSIRFKDRSHVTNFQFQFLTNVLTWALSWWIFIGCRGICMFDANVRTHLLKSITVFTVANSSLWLYNAIRPPPVQVHVLRFKCDYTTTHMSIDDGDDGEGKLSASRSIMAHKCNRQFGLNTVHRMSPSLMAALWHFHWAYTCILAFRSQLEWIAWAEMNLNINANFIP